MKITERVGSWLMLLPLLAGCAGQDPTPTATSPTQAAVSAAHRPGVQLGTSMRFAAPDGSEQFVPSGTYRVERADETHLRLVTDRPQTVRDIAATSFTHEETLTAPLSFMVREAEHEDTVHLLLMLPDGTGLDAAGRIGDVQTRGGDLRFQSRARYTGMVMQQGPQQTAANAQKHIDMQRQIEAEKQRLEELQRQLEEAQDRNGFEQFTGGLFGSDGGAGDVSANRVIRMESARCKTCKMYLTR